MSKKSGNFLTRLFGASGGGSRNPTDERWWTPGAVPGRATTAVTPDTVLQIPEVHACLSVLSQDVAQLPFYVFEATESGERRRLRDHPVSILLGEQSNISQETTAFELRGQMTHDAAFFRNAYAEIRFARGRLELVRIDPQAVDVRVNRGSGAWAYEVQDGANRRMVLPEDMLHLRMTPLDSSNLRGRSMLVDGYRVFSRILTMEDYNFRFYENDARPGGLLKYTKSFKNAEDRQLMRDRWRRIFGGRGRGLLGVLEDGEEYVSVEAKNSDAQFIETYQHAANQICRLWRVPPHKIGILDKSTNNNIEHQGIDYVASALMPLLIMWEQAIKRSLLAEPRFYAHHNVAGLLRGDMKSRYEAYAQGRSWGWLSANDVRRLENENAIENGDIYLQPVNMAPAGTDYAALQRQNQQQPQQGALLFALENVLARRLLPAPSGE